ncbi:porphobilinogen synthase [Aliarcobacter butzleri]|jgi:porphobilinogen synthase|uniref:Delta-aminolevulinic acid dehydratase n=3 Tax=Aliarcobacter butzleri TaxID=28197 RepID=A0AAP4P736_9BACT|nr:porphobilinogen synthase [Aliarcobacter butzleri]AGR77532.1 porphobilinogen synthase [Aliarcobacter butzleri 7h1h]EFU69222.1 porphobilinogen synthase [Aliarcobacter butzleri JV22]KLD97166.1 delta-aminolevulinic acid dehydratase [Aliarcobacter butzleri L349]KLE02284.1 delta-aminolevulinic acid dehydratase [Aliarcobacter butzleri L351]KLE06968.1 delta-aminolevulinic acid dehydratase [Aliarcobacter butzleri L353]
MFKRFRRLRINETLRNLVQETVLTPEDFIYPLFVKEGKGIKTEVASMPGVYQMSLDEILKECEYLHSINLKSIILFGIPDVKDSVGSECLCEESIIARTIKAIKAKFPDMFIVTDLCFCEYTDHGHCGILDPKTQTVDNDKTLEISALQALVHARAGADMIAPSGMMDGIITTLRTALDTNGFKDLPIMAYSTKFASGYYGPFRDVAESTPSFGDRRSYQMNPANRLEAIEESLEDERQGADILMVKPALAFLDVIRDIRNETNLPLCAYNVSGEYAMLKHAGLAGLIDYERVMMETMIAFKRAGANIIITYHAKEACEILRKK